MMFFNKGVPATRIIRAIVRGVIVRGVVPGAVFLGAVSTVPAGAETLTDALTKAYLNNPDLAAQRASLRAVDENVPQARANYLPSLEARGSYGKSERSNFFTESQQPGSSTTLTPKQSSVTLSQPIFRGFSTVNSVRQAKSEVRAGRAELTTVEQETLLSAVTAYMNVLRDQAVLDVTQNQVDVLKRQLDATRNRFEVGEITRTDVAQSEARLAGAVSDRIEAEAQLTASRTQYRRIVGDTPGTLEPPPDLPSLPESERAAVDRALEGNPLLIAAEYREQAARYSVNSLEGALLPQVDLQASYSKGLETFTPGDISETKEVTAQVTIPLYQGGARYSQIRQAKQRRSQRQLEIIAAQRQVVEQVRNAWIRLRAARATIDSNDAQVEAIKIALDGVRQEAQVGARTTLDVLDAEQELLNARVNLIRAERNEYVASFELLSAVGRLTARKLDLPVETYDPAQHYEDVDNQWIGWSID